jgi:hypothetical protein
VRINHLDSPRDEPPHPSRRREAWP